MSDKKNQKTVLFWVDLETTGLDELTGEILEYAVVLTDLELNEIDSVEGVLAHDMTYLPTIMDPFVTEMHTKNGLLEAIRLASVNVPNAPWGWQAARVVQNILVGMLLRLKQSDPDTIFVIAGSTVGFDRRWLKQEMPELEKMLHYRQLDVSVYKVGFPEIFGTKTSEAHRAMADIRASIDVHRRMRNIVLSLRDLATK